MSQSASQTVLDSDVLARFILRSKEIRTDKSVKPDAFIPFPYQDLSVFNHTGLACGEIWQLGQEVAAARPATLYGSADLVAKAYTDQNLGLYPDQPPKNHFNVSGWASEKSQQKIVALLLSKQAHFVECPSASGSVETDLST